MCLCETTGSRTYARVLGDKIYSGAFDPKVHMAEQFMRAFGHKIVTLQGDCEASVMKLIEDVSGRFVSLKDTQATQVSILFSASLSSNSHGSVERAIRIVRGQCRVMYGALTHRF